MGNCELMGMEMDTQKEKSVSWTEVGNTLEILEASLEISKLWC